MLPNTLKGKNLKELPFPLFTLNFNLIVLDIVSKSRQIVACGPNSRQLRLLRRDVATHQDKRRTVLVPPSPMGARREHREDQCSPRNTRDTRNLTR
jgi:hypothetical protein